MTAADPLQFITTLKAMGISRVAGVPCSSMTGLINEAQTGRILAYTNAPNEGEALAYAAGLWLGGGAGAVICQNSGVGNLFNALTSLLIPYDIPALIIVGWRGRPGERDEPQHQLMGRITAPIFDLCGIPTRAFASAADMYSVAALAAAAFASRQPSAVLVTANAFESRKAELGAVTVSLPPTYSSYQPGQSRVGRREAIETVAAVLSADTMLVATTGLISRECCAVADRPENFYMAGSMGHVLPIGIGVHAASGRPVLLIDGDGAILMRAAGLAMAGAIAQSPLAHLVLDNGVHASTGGQSSLSSSVDLANAARAFGYRQTLDTSDLTEAVSICRAGLAGEGPVFVRLRIQPDGTVPPRISLDFSDVAARFRTSTLSP